MQGHYDKGQSLISIVFALPSTLKGIQSQNYPKLLKQTYARKSPLLSLHMKATLLERLIMALLSLLPRWLSDYWHIHPDTAVAAERESRSAFCLRAAAELTPVASICIQPDPRHHSKRQQPTILSCTTEYSHRGCFFFYSWKGRLRPWESTSN